MPWWFWLITHVWILSSGIVFTVGIKEDEIGVSSWREVIYSIGMVIIAPFLILLGISVVIWDTGKVKVHQCITPDNWLRRFFENRKQKKEDEHEQMEQERRVKEEVDRDFKEMEDNEDEWRIERLGIKLR